MKAKVPLIVAAAALAVAAGISASTRFDTAPTKIVITVLPSRGATTPEPIRPSDVSVQEGNAPVPVVSLQRLSGDLAGVQLFILLDDSSQSSSLSVHFGELRAFINSLPAGTQVAIGYMRNGGHPQTQTFTTNHEQAANALRLPLGIPGVNGSPYFSLSALVDRWPAEQPARRRVVLMLSDGVDSYFGASTLQDPYVDTAIRNAVEHGVAVYPIYLRGTGWRSSQVTNMAQSRLAEVAEETGGYAYFQGFSNPVTITPFLNDLNDRLANQYEVTLAGLVGKGLQPIKVRSATPGLKISGPARVYLP